MGCWGLSVSTVPVPVYVAVSIYSPVTPVPVPACVAVSIYLLPRTSAKNYGLFEKKEFDEEC